MPNKAEQQHRLRSWGEVLRPLVSLGLVNVIVFLSVWTMRFLYTGTPFAHAIQVLYWITGILGFVLLVYGFILLIRHGGRQLSEAVLLVLFAMIPGLILLIFILSHVGTQPV